MREREIQTLKDVREYRHHLLRQRMVIENDMTQRLSGVEGSRMSDEAKRELVNRTLQLAGSLDDAEITINTYLQQLEEKQLPQLKVANDLIRFAKKRQEEYRGKIQPF